MLRIARGREALNILHDSACIVCSHFFRSKEESNCLCHLYHTLREEIAVSSLILAGSGCNSSYGVLG
jgi:hypothetical protein